MSEVHLEIDVQLLIQNGLTKRHELVFWPSLVLTERTFSLELWNQSCAGHASAVHSKGGNDVGVRMMTDCQQCQYN